MRKERERRYIAEYMLETFPRGDYQLNVELGAIPSDYVQRYGSKKAAALFRPTRPRVDAVAWTPDEYLIIEAKLRDIKAGIGDLMYYYYEAQRAPDLPNYDGQPIKKRLIIPWMIDWMHEAARTADIEVVVYVRPWLEEYIKDRQLYFTAEYREKRSQVMKDREILGLD